jgi:hypothetical protein
MSSQTAALQAYVYFNVETLWAALSAMVVTCDSSIFRHCSFVFGANVVCKNCGSHTKAAEDSGLLNCYTMSLRK